MVGDFNCPDICWSSLCGSCTCSDMLCEMIFECNFTQLVRGATHTKGNLLDLVLVSDEDLISAFKVHSRAETPLDTDHFMISFSLEGGNTASSCQSPVLVFDYPKADWNGLCNYLLDYDFSLCFESSDVDTIWLILKRSIESAMDIFIPKVRLRQFQFPRWFTPDIRHKYKCLQSLEKKCVNNPSSSNIVKATGDLREEIELAKASYERRLINDFARTNNSRIYKYLGELRRGSDIPSTVHDDVASASASKDKANLFNNYFHSVFTVTNYLGMNCLQYVI